MKTIGIMSDTHGNVLLMNQVADIMVQEFHADVIIHAGDDFADAETLECAGHNVVKVPGLSCDAYYEGSARTILDTFDGITVACAHAERDLHARELAAAVVITGHTHVASVQRIGRSLYINPGHLKGPLDRGERPSFAIALIADDAVRATIREVDGAIRTEEVVPRGLLG